MGISIAPLLQRGPGLPFITALQQFWDEFESYFGYGSVAEKGLVRSCTVYNSVVFIQVHM
jgi:hypothetical protein